MNGSRCPEDQQYTHFHINTTGPLDPPESSTVKHKENNPWLRKGTSTLSPEITGGLFVENGLNGTALITPRRAMPSALPEKPRGEKVSRSGFTVETEESAIQILLEMIRVPRVTRSIED